MNKRQISNRVTDMSLAIPAYNRSAELKELLCSLENQALLPAEIIICEDCSPEREAIRSIANYYRPVFAQRGCCVNYIENSNNLGYDGNVRKLLCEASQKWVMLMGNDDLVLPGCFERAENFIDNNPQVNIISRAFVRFSNDINSPLGVSRLSANDRLFVNGKDKPRMIFRSCGFVGGLIVNTAWARQYDTAKYDGSLFYQIFLSALAFCQDGIGYISTPIVGGRAGNPPLFGSAQAEKSVHVSGSYSPKGRARMWQSVLEICSEVGETNGINLVDDVRRELMIRQSFHVFEMMTTADKRLLIELRAELRKIGLYQHPFPAALYWLVRLLGPHAKAFFDLSRKLMQ